VESRAHRRYFRLEGLVAGRPVLAAIRTGDLIADEELMQQARLVVALGETCERPNGNVMAASLDGPPMAVMLTLIRACDRPISVQLGPASPPELWGSGRE